MLWDQCPGLFKDRYIDGIAMETTEAMAFGSAVHKGLEEHFRGGDGEYAFRQTWKAYGPDGSHLTAMGLDLIDLVRELGLEGHARATVQPRHTGRSRRSDRRLHRPGRCGRHGVRLQDDEGQLVPGARAERGLATRALHVGAVGS